MELSSLIPLVAAVGGVLSLGVLVWMLFLTPKVDYRSLMGARVVASPNADVRERIENDETGEELEKVKNATRKSFRKNAEPTLQEKMFRAGLFTERQRKDFQRLRILLPSVGAVVLMGFGWYAAGWQMGMLAAVIGLLAGFYIPFRIIERRMKQRSEDILFYLPLVIEQISIGVSSSLDIGPCLARVVQMADERDSHNAVTELVRYAQYHVKSGVGLEEALTEVGKLSGQVELKHAFMALAQVAKFGGEVSKQLQELADAVSSQRETKIEAKIKKLELEATAPVALVFFGYLVILLIGFLLQILTAL
jgi:pilus assembly protein TadC